MATIVGNLNQQELDQAKQNQPSQQNQGETISGSGIAPSQSSTQTFNQAQQAPRQIGSGRFTNIQQYLGANKQAGQQLGQNLQQGISQKLNQAQGTAGRTLGEATQQQSQAQQAYQQGWQQYASLGGQPNQFVQAPQYKDASGNLIQQQPVVQQQQYSFAAPTGDEAAKGTLAKEYIADIGSRQKAAMDIASNEEALKAFSGLRTGETQTQQGELIKQKTQAARDTAEALKAQQEQRMQQLATESGRGGLLSEFVGGKNYGVGQRSLDAAFLQRDPNRSLNLLKQNIGARASDIKQGLANVGTAEEQAKALASQGTELSKGLGAQTAQNTQDYLANIQSRIPLMEAQRKAKLDWAQKQLTGFKEGKNLNEEFLRDLDVATGTQLFNVPKEIKDVGDVLDVSNLTKSLGLSDVANQRDIENYAAMAKLQGLSPGEYGLTKSTADTEDIQKYQDQRTLSARAAKAKEDFLKRAMQDVVTGETGSVGGMRGYASQSVMDFLTGGSNRARQVVNAAVGQGFNPNSLAGLSAAAGQTGQQVLGTLGMTLGNPAEILQGQAINAYGQNIAEAASRPGGDVEKGLHAGLAALTPGSVLPGDLGTAARNVAGVGQDLISNLTNAFGIGGDNSYEESKDRGYARSRSDAYLDNALASYLKNAGFSNYMGDTGLKTAESSIKGTWDGTTWQNPAQDLEAFGYGKQMLAQGITPKLGAIAPQTPQVGMYQPAIQQAALTGGTNDRKALLEQLAATGQLNDTTGLENLIGVT